MCIRDSYARVQGFRDRSQGIVDGNLSEADALREVRAMLKMSLIHI